MHVAAAVKAGDLGAARAALEDPPGWPNCFDPYLSGRDDGERRANMRWPPSDDRQPRPSPTA